MKKFILAIILVITALLRWYNNTAIALWHDEAFSALYIRYHWGEMMHRIVLDVHPPLYYIVLRFWAYLFGDALVSLRSLSILFGVLTVWAGYAFIKKAFNSVNLGLITALFLAVNPFQIQYSLEARMYTMGTFLVMLSSWLLLRALESRRKRDWVFYALSAVAAFYTHYYLLFSIAAQALYALYAVYKSGSWKRPLKDNQLVNLVMAGAIALVIYIPWVPSLLQQIKRVSGGYWIPPMDRWSIPGTVWKITFGGDYIGHNTLIVGCIATFIFLWYFIKKYREQEKWLVILGLVIPFLAAILLSLKSAIYQDRYFVFASLSISILAALTLSAIPKAIVRRVLVSLFIVFSVWMFWRNWTQLDVRDFGSSFIKKPGMAAAGSYIDDRANINANDKIYVGSSFIFFTFKYYNETGIAPKLISGSPLSGIPHYAGTAILTDDDLVLNDYIFTPANYKKNEIIWLLWTTGFGGSKPNVPGNWVNISNQTWLDTPAFKGDITVSQYRVE